MKKAWKIIFILFVLVFIYAPILILIFYSFTDATNIGAFNKFSLDNYVTLEGKFTTVLKTVVKDGHYYFATHNNGMDTVKSPIGMFEDDLIENDLKMVDDVMREYWGIPRGGENGKD